MEEPACLGIAMPLSQVAEWYHEVVNANVGAMVQDIDMAT
jgi:hypothetical protein